MSHAPRAIVWAVVLTALLSTIPAAQRGTSERPQVEEITIASNLRDMFERIETVGSDVDRRSHILTGSILIGRMTVAGE